MLRNFTRVASAGLAACLFVASTTANAAIYAFNYSGTVTAAENFTFPLFGPPATVAVGDKFFGSFTLDTEFNATSEDGIIYEGLRAITFNLPSQNYTEDFNGPLGIVEASATGGGASIVGGRGDFGRGLGIDLVYTSDHFDPIDLYGKSGQLSFNNFFYPGFSVKGIATIDPVSTVPETATWGMMILGFVGIGAAVRYRRKSTKVAFA